MRSFTAISGNLVGAPALVGNVLVWKPSPMATYSSWLVLQILLDAGLPKNVIQFLPTPNGDATISLVDRVLEHRMFAGLHFTGSTHVFRHLWKKIGNNIDRYLSYPRVVGETGGKNFQLVHPSADVRAAVIGAIRGAFEYQGQKCSALSRLYVPQTMWDGEFKETLLAEVKKITQGSVAEFEHFMGPVMCVPSLVIMRCREQRADPPRWLCPTHSSQASYDKCLSYVEKAKQAGGEVLAGGSGDDSKGFFVQPTVILTKDPLSPTMVDEIFGPVLTVYVYEDNKFEETCSLIDTTTTYALTGCIFSNDRAATVKAGALLRYSAGNYYINVRRAKRAPSPCTQGLTLFLCPSPGQVDRCRRRTACVAALLLVCLTSRAPTWD
mgnify:CR=1 FL=1